MSRFDDAYAAAREAQARQAPWPEVQQLFLDAHALAPERAEPLCDLAWHYFQHTNYPLMYLFARHAAECPWPPPETRDVDWESYRFRRYDLLGIAAYYVGELEVGEKATRQALLYAPHLQRLHDNLRYYLRA